jgi:hypothetical protein
VDQSVGLVIIHLCIIVYHVHQKEKSLKR